MITIIDAKVHAKIRHWMNKAGTFEVSGLGNVIYDKASRTFKVTEAWLLDQENTGVSSILDSNAITKLMVEHSKWVDEGSIKGELKFWWHSHANMQAFWSGTDEQAIAELSEHGWFLNTVLNHKGDMLTCVAMNKPLSFRADKVPTYVEAVADPAAEELLQKLADLGYTQSHATGYEPTDIDKATWDAEYDANVKTKTYLSTTHAYVSAEDRKKMFAKYNKIATACEKKGDFESAKYKEAAFKCDLIDDLTGHYDAGIVQDAINQARTFYQIDDKDIVSWTKDVYSFSANWLLRSLGLEQEASLEWPYGTGY